MITELRKLGEINIREPAMPSWYNGLDHLPKALLSGFDILSDLPASFETLLNRVHEGTLEDVRSTQVAYGQPLVRLMRSSGVLVGRLQPLFLEHKRTWGHIRQEKDERGWKALLSSNEQKRFCDATGVSEGARCSRRQAVKALKAANLIVSASSAEQYLGVIRPHFKVLEREGHLQPIMNSRRAQTKWYYKSELEAFARTLQGDAPLIDFASRTHRRWKAELKSGGLTTPQLVAAVLSGQRKCVAVLKNTNGLRSLLFAAPPKKQIETAPHANELPRHEVQHLCRLRRDEMAELVVSGLLPITWGRGHTHLVARADARSFKNNFIARRVIEQATGIWGKALLTELARGGVSKIDGLSKVELYDRSSVEALFGSLGPLHADQI